MESVKYDVCLAITGAIKSTSKENLYDPLGLESLQLLLVQKVILFFKFTKMNLLSIFPNIVPLRHSSCTTRNAKNIPLFKIKHNFLKNSFFPSAIIE